MHSQGFPSVVVGVRADPAPTRRQNNPYASAVTPSASVESSFSMAGSPLLPAFEASFETNRSTPPPQPSGTVPFEELCQHAGELVHLARTAGGSSYIQTALRDDTDGRVAQMVWGELIPNLGDLLLDAHGGYVIKTLMDMVSPDQQQSVIASITSDDSLAFSLCTHSLHTRRVVQHVMEMIDPHFLLDILIRRCHEIAPTQQGCIVMQRAMDNAIGTQRDALLSTIALHTVVFARDPFANYVIQHLLEIGARDASAPLVWSALRGRVCELSCNKFASNVIEKCLFHFNSETQHDLLDEMYSGGPEVLYQMLQDSFGNYIIQSSIALATQRDLVLLSERLRPVLAHVPYGHKIEARLERRLKGKPVTAKSGNRGSRKQQHASFSSASASFEVPAGEMPW